MSDSDGRRADDRANHRARIGVLVAAVVLVSGVAALVADDDEHTVVTARREAQGSTSTTTATTTTEADGSVDGDDPAAAPDPSPVPPDEPAPPADSGEPDPARCPNYVADPGPDDTPPDPDHERLDREQQRLDADAAAVRRYGAGHPETYAGSMYANHPRVRVVVAFTADLQAHCDALRARLQHPDEFELRSSPYTERELDRIQREIVSDLERRHPGLLRSSGRGFQPFVPVQLRADGEAVAAELVERYGDAVDVTVGFHPYPRSRIQGPAAYCGGPLGDDMARRPGVDGTLTLDPASIRRGSDTRGVLTIRNTGIEAFEFHAGAPSEAGIVVAPGTTSVVSHWDTAMAAAAQGGRLGPGESRDIPVIVGTAACDPADGYALAPGRYGVVVLFQVTWERSGRTEHALSREGTLHLTG